MRAVLDTNMLVAESLARGGYEIAVSSLSWAELRYGIRKAKNPVEAALRETRLTRLHALLGDGLPFDDAAADSYGTLCGVTLAGGRDVRGRVVDLMIAATALANGAAIITRNIDDFAGLDELVPILAG